MQSDTRNTKNEKGVVIVSATGSKSAGQKSRPVKPGHVTVTGAVRVGVDDDDDDVVTVTLLFLSAL